MNHPSSRYHIAPQATRTITALLTLPDQVIAPLLAGWSRAPERDSCDGRAPGGTREEPA